MSQGTENEDISRGQTAAASTKGRGGAQFPDYAAGVSVLKLSELLISTQTAIPYVHP